jgi:hypothetical protein
MWNVARFPLYKTFHHNLRYFVPRFLELMKISSLSITPF